jgi:hypothetical protein
LYFAVEEEPPESGCAIWAVDMEWVESKARKLLPPTETGWGDFRERAAYVNRLLRSRTEKAVILPVNPSRLDARIVAQQGFFLCKLRHEAHFSSSLMHMMMHPKTSEGPDLPDQPVIRKLILNRAVRIEFLKKLRAMNIHRASLYPGLDGFGQSLRLDLEIKLKS